MSLTSLLGTTASELGNVLLGGAGGNPPAGFGDAVLVGTTLVANASVAASFSSGVQVGTSLRVQPSFSTRVLVGHSFIVDSVYASMNSPVQVGSKFVAYAGALASGRWRH